MNSSSSNPLNAQIEFQFNDYKRQYEQAATLEVELSERLKEIQARKMRLDGAMQALMALRQSAQQQAVPAPPTVPSAPSAPDAPASLPEPTPEIIH